MTQERESHREIILSLSKKKGDFVVSTSRSSGPGGQNVNKRDTKVRITHPASGAFGESQTHKEQEKNRREAFRRLVDSPKFQTWLRAELARRGHTEAPGGLDGPTGSRGEKIRTYHFPRDEVVDHRIGLKTKGVKKVLDGRLDEIVRSLREEARCRLSQCNNHDSERLCRS